ncbi:MAG TPA: putative molybdenum carrier protein [Kofleriaceae bacterium]|nr:putative molybdenum carrier protein [Kofleriaceae bacterium]
MTAHIEIDRIVSGGQTGADRGALDAALELGIEHGGYCPAGRRAEDGRIPERYRLVETASSDYAVRTERNVVESDGTLLVTRGTPTGGSALTASLARARGRPLLHIDLSRRAGTDEHARALREWIAARGIRTLNVAGPRESGCPGIAQDVRTLLVAALTNDVAVG